MEPQITSLSHHNSQISSNLNRSEYNAVALRCKKSLLLGLGIAKAIFPNEVRLPASIQQVIEQDASVNQLIQRTFKWLLPKAQFSASHNHAWEPTYYRLTVCETPSDKVRHLIWKTLVPNVRDRRILPLPNLFSWLYYLIRPIRLLAKRAGIHSDDISPP